MTKSPTIVASLVLRDFGDDPQIVTRLLNHEPTRSGLRGDHLLDPMGRVTARMIRRTYWSLHSGAPKTAPLNRHVADILGQLTDSYAAFYDLPKGTTITLRCTVIPEGDLPLLRVDPESLRSLGQIGAGLEFDVIEVDGPADPPPPAQDAG